jgi:hypothetical protein
MSTQLHDFARQAVLGVGLTPRTATATVTGPIGDLIAGDGRCFAVQQVGALTGSGASIAGKIQESADASTWSDVADAAFTTVTTADNVQAVTFSRTQRYVRYVGTVAGSSPSIPVAVIISEQRKQL